jgi:thiamine biosynthesis lipoprotein
MNSAPAHRRVAIPLDVDTRDLDRPGDDAQLFSFGGETMGTTWSIRFYAPADFVPGFLLTQIDALFARITQQMSLWARDSDINRFNRAPAGAWIALPEPFFSVLSAALDTARETGGAFDPTLAALADRWGFGPTPAGALPSEVEVAALRDRAGWRRLELDRETRRALQPGGLALDLNAIAKGDAVDRLGEALNQASLRVWLAEIGGELRGRGRKPDGQPWWIQLETGPEQADNPIVVALSGLSAATSGAYRRQRGAGESAVCHTIDPQTGAALGADLRTVTVLVPECSRADALATALFVMGPQLGQEFATRHAIPALFAHAAGETITPALEAMLA